MKKIILVSLVLATVIIGCKSPKETTTVKTVTPPPAPFDCSAKNLAFTADIKPVFEANCTSCHGYGGAAGYDFQTITDISRAAKNGDLLGTIKWEKGFKKMPAHAEQLDATTISKIECWINNGMKE